MNCWYVAGNVALVAALSIKHNGERNEQRWRTGRQPRIEDFLLGGDPVYRDGLLRELLLAEWELLRRHEQHIELKTYSEPSSAA